MHEFGYIYLLMRSSVSFYRIIEGKRPA